MKIVVTGGAGFIGRSLIAALPARHDVVVIDWLIDDVHGAGAEFPADLRGRATCIRCDVADVDAWRDAARGCHVVVHLAALTGTGQSARQPQRYLDHNVTATSRLFEVLASFQPLPQRVVLASSRAVYGEGPYRDGDRLVHPGRRCATALAAGRWEITNAAGDILLPAAAVETTPAQPASVYAETKAAQERQLREFAARHHVEWLVLRLQNVYGPLQTGANPHAGIIATLARGVLHDRRVELFEDGAMTRDFVHVDDCVRAIAAGIDHAAPLQHTFNVGTGQRTSLRDVVALLATMTGDTPVVACTGRYRVGDVRHAAADTTAFEKFFGAGPPIDLADGLAAYAGWLARHVEERPCR